MTRRVGRLLAVGVICHAMGAVAEERTTLNGEWEFQPQREYRWPAAFEHRIHVPSFWSQPQAFGYPESWRTLPAGWFRRRVDVPEEWRGQRIALRFDAICMTGQIFFNGRHLANHWDSTNPVTVDVTPHVKWGESNEIVVGVRAAIAESEDLFDPADATGPAAGSIRSGRRDRPGGGLHSGRNATTAR